MQSKGEKVNMDKTIVDAIRELMKDNPDGVSFCQLYAHAFENPNAVPENNDPVPSKEMVFRELDKVCKYDGLVVLLESGLYSAPDLDELAHELDIFDLIKSFK